MTLIVDESHAHTLYAKRKEKMTAKRNAKIDSRDFSQRAETRFIRSIANDCSPLPEIVNPARREETRLSLRLFAEYYFPAKFFLGWASSHLELIETLERCVMDGEGNAAFALPRGSGKTSLAETAAIWALFHGHKRYALCLGAKGELGKNLFHSIKSEIENNELLLADYPEICYPFAFAERNPVKYRFQTYEGIPTQITYTSDSLSFPNISHSKVAGNYILCSSITSGLRGLKRTNPRGENMRPDFVIIDDPQTDKSARSPAMTHQRERIIQGAIMGLAGPRQPLTVVMPCTVIQQDDLADRFLNRDTKPEWRGQRTKLLSTFPTNMQLWNEYLDIRKQDFRDGGNGSKGTEFYSINMEAMNAGAETTWTDRYNPPLEISAIQHAMNIYFRDPIAFASEYQNAPLLESKGESRPSVDLKASDILKRLSGLPYGNAPRDTIYITSGVDVQKDALYYVTVAWRADFGGTIVDYGTCPDQPREYFNLYNIPVPLSAKFGNLLQSPITNEALVYLNSTALSRSFKREESGDDIPVDTVFVDANWNLSADAVYQFCKMHSDKYWPCHGKGIGPSMLPMDQWQKKVGDVPHKANWRIRTSTLGSNRGRNISFDTNFWKSRIGERLTTHIAAPNSLLLYGSSQTRHQLLADHLASEAPERTSGRGRDVDEWKRKANQENHYFDCLILAAVAASKCGLELLEVTTTTTAEDNSIISIAAPIPKAERRIALPPPARKTESY